MNISDPVVLEIGAGSGWLSCALGRELADITSEIRLSRLAAVSNVNMHSMSDDIESDVIDDIELMPRFQIIAVDDFSRSVRQRWSCVQCRDSVDLLNSFPNCACAVDLSDCVPMVVNAKHVDTVFGDGSFRTSVYTGSIISAMSTNCAHTKLPQIPSPHFVICAWMPFLVDWTAAIRTVNSVVWFYY